jgi:hypothetical protein
LRDRVVVIASLDKDIGPFDEAVYNPDLTSRRIQSILCNPFQNPQLLRLVVTTLLLIPE